MVVRGLAEAVPPVINAVAGSIVRLASGGVRSEADNEKSLDR
jgi:hypothetical protein